MAEELLQLIETIGLDETSHRLVVKNSGGNALMISLYDSVFYTTPHTGEQCGHTIFKMGGRP